MLDSYQLAQLFQPYLMTGERILWSGHPKQGLALGGRDVYLIPFSLMWGGFAILWNALVWFAPFDDSGGEGPDFLFKLWGLPFLIIGLYLIFGRFLHDAHVRKRVAYAVTDQRVLIMRGPRFSSLDLSRLPRLDLDEHRDGTGTLTFESGGTIFSGGRQGFNYWVPALDDRAQFFRIQQPRSIYELIRQQSRA